MTVMNYDLLAPRKIVFGWGRRQEIARLAAGLGRRAFLVCGGNALIEQGVIREVQERLAAEGIVSELVATIEHEPEVADVDRLTPSLRSRAAQWGDLMLAVGGGSAIDLAKALAAMIPNRQGESVRDYLEGVGRDLKLTEQPLPILAVPTTAGTGAEATRNAVISSYDPPYKKSLRDERLVPQIALVDPELTVPLPASTTAAGGMDTITQLLESYLSRKAQPIPQALARQGLMLAVRAIAEAVRDGASRPARERMAHAALLSGICLANSGLGMAHGVAAALGVHCRVPHGVACAVMLPAALRTNRAVRDAEMAELASLLYPEAMVPATADPAAVLIDRIEALCRTVGVPGRLSDLGVRREQLPQLVRDSRGSSMSGNPRDLTDDELAGILEALL